MPSSPGMTGRPMGRRRDDTRLLNLRRKIGKRLAEGFDIMAVAAGVKHHAWVKDVTAGDVDPEQLISGSGGPSYPLAPERYRNKAPEPKAPRQGGTKLAAVRRRTPARPFPPSTHRESSPRPMARNRFRRTAKRRLDRSPFSLRRKTALPRDRAALRPSSSATSTSRCWRATIAQAARGRSRRIRAEAAAAATEGRGRPQALRRGP